MKKLIVITAFVLLGILSNSAVAKDKADKKSTCPCDFKAPVHWAGWLGPECFVNAGSESVSIQLFSDNSSSTPQIAVVDNFTSGVADCWTVSQVSNVENIVGFSGVEELAACYEELNELAITLGRIDGCVVP